MKNAEAPKKNRLLIPNLQKASQVLTFLSQHEEALKRETEAIIKQIFLWIMRYLSKAYVTSLPHIWPREKSGSFHRYHGDDTALHQEIDLLNIAYFGKF